MNQKRVALATCAELPDGDEDFPAIVEHLAAAGIAAEAAIWDAPHVPWSDYDLVVVRATWNYARRHDAFLDSPAVIELELTEPSLFLGQGQGAVQRVAEAIRKRL